MTAEIISTHFNDLEDNVTCFAYYYATATQSDIVLPLYYTGAKINNDYVKTTNVNYNFSIEYRINNGNYQNFGTIYSVPEDKVTISSDFITHGTDSIIYVKLTPNNGGNIDGIHFGLYDDTDNIYATKNNLYGIKVGKMRLIDALSINDENSLNGYFQNCVNLQVWNENENENYQILSNVVTNLSNCFNGCAYFNGNISNWNVSNVTNMFNMFNSCTKFDGNISNWNTSLVTDMNQIFYDCSVFNQDISNWKTHNVTNMSSMFTNCINFNQNISDWDTSNVTNMSWMFDNCQQFNQNLNWDTSKVVNMDSMFTSCYYFNGDISNWDTSNVINMKNMFNNCFTFNQDISNWDTSSVTNMNNILSECTSFNQNIGKWDLTNVTDITNMLYNTYFSVAIMDAILLGWSEYTLNDISYSYNRTSYSRTYVGNNLGYSETTLDTLSYEQSNDCVLLVYNNENNNNISITLPVNITENVTVYINANYYLGFNHTVNNNSINIAQYITNVFIVGDNITWLRPDDEISRTSLTDIKECGSLVFDENNTNYGYFEEFPNLYWSSIDALNLTNIGNLSRCFYNCTSFNGNISNWDVSNVTTMSNMFYNCILFNQPLDWDVSNVTTMSNMFYNCILFDQDISNWDISLVENFENFCYGVTISENNYDNILISWLNKVKEINETHVINFGNSISSFNDTIKREYLNFNYEIIDGGDIIKGISNEILSIKNKIIFTMSDLISNLNTSNEQFRVLINVIATKNTTKEIDKIICTFINN